MSENEGITVCEVEALCGLACTVCCGSIEMHQHGQHPMRLPAAPKERHGSDVERSSATRNARQARVIQGCGQKQAGGLAVYQPDPSSLLICSPGTHQMDHAVAISSRWPHPRIHVLELELEPLLAQESPAAIGQMGALVHPPRDYNLSQCTLSAQIAPSSSKVAKLTAFNRSTAVAGPDT